MAEIASEFKYNKSLYLDKAKDWTTRYGKPEGLELKRKSEASDATDTENKAPPNKVSK